MNTKKGFGLVSVAIFIAAVLAIWGVVELASNNKNTDKAPTTESEVKEETASSTEETKVPAGKKMSFDAFMKQGGSYVCTVNQDVGGMTSKGTVYINGTSGQNIRGEFTTSVQGMNIGTSLIVRDGFTYTWSSMMPTTGYKVAVSKSDVGANVNQGASGSYSWNAEQIGDYDCKPWTVDATKFDLPKTVKFTEVKQQ